MPGSQNSAIIEDMADNAASDIIKGDDALVSAADLIFQAMRSDDRLQSQFATVDLPTLALNLRTFLSSAFEGGEWPEIRPTDAISNELCGELFGVLMEVFAQPLSLGEDPMICGMEALNTTFSGDPRVVGFFDHIRAAATAAAAESRAASGNGAAEIEKEGAKIEEAGDDEHEEEGEEAVEVEEVAISPTAF